MRKLYLAGPMADSAVPAGADTAEQRAHIEADALREAAYDMEQELADIDVHLIFVTRWLQDRATRIKAQS